MGQGAYLPQPQTKKSTREQSGNGFRYCSVEMQGWRKTMEDADIHCCDVGDGNAIFGVFDGHGGHQVSKYVQQMFIQTLKSIPAYENKNYKEAFVRCFKLIDQKIQSEAGQAKLKSFRGTEGSQVPMNSMNSSGMKISASVGCTANVVLITKDKYYIANIGDSRAALGLKNKKATQLSYDHKPQSQIQKTRIYKAGGQIIMGRVNGGLNLSRSFGDFDYKQNKQIPYDQQMITCHPDVYEYDRSKDDQFILIGCDGIWQKYVQDSDGLCNKVKELLKKHNGKYKQALQQLLDNLMAKQTREGLGCDNMTAILIGFQ